MQAASATPIAVAMAKRAGRARHRGFGRARGGRASEVGAATAGPSSATCAGDALSAAFRASCPAANPKPTRIHR
jgi:hypothetical protein